MSSELKNRILFGALFSILALLAILAPYNHVFFLLVVALLFFMNYEYLQIAAAMGKALQPLLIYAPIALLGVFWFYQLNFQHRPPPFWYVLVWAGLFGLLFLIPRRHRLFFYGLNLCWIWLPTFFLLAVYQTEQGKTYILFLVLVVIASDIFSYFGGKAFGKHKLAPNISPGKTWEGSLAGFIGALAVGAGYLFFFPFFPWPAGLGVILGITLLAQLGDLFESFWKRQGHMKDASSIIPGHGGFLDRMDSFLFSAPFLALTLL